MKYRTDFHSTGLGWPSLTPFAIGPHSDPYMLRWRLLPKNLWANLYLHLFRHDDDDRAEHDHPWPSASILLWGHLDEISRGRRRRILPLLPTLRRAATPHRLVVPNGRAVTLFFSGPRIREWYFRCEDGPMHWRDFTNSDNPGEVGKGCASRRTVTARSRDFREEPDGDAA